jgi:membrane protein implicated in regulation of membrane protease activity
MDFGTWPSTILMIVVGLLVLVALFFLLALVLRLLGWIFRGIGAFLAIASYWVALLILVFAMVGWYQYSRSSATRADPTIRNRMRCEYRYGASMVQRKYTNGVTFYRCEGSKND